MKNSVITMYRIGRFFSYILVAVYLTIFIAGIITLISAVNDIHYSPTLLVKPIILLFFSVIALFFLILCIIKASQTIHHDGYEITNSDHIKMIILGGLSLNVFYLLGGIFALNDNKEKE